MFIFILFVMFAAGEHVGGGAPVRADAGGRAGLHPLQVPHPLLSCKNNSVIG